MKSKRMSVSSKKRSFLLVIGVFLLLTGFSPLGAEETPCSYTDLFEEIGAVVRGNFYDPERIDERFPEIQAGYRARIARASTRKEFSDLVNRMLRELNASHTYYLTPEDSEYYRLCALFSEIPEIGALFQGRDVLYPSVGILTQTIEARVFVAAVLAGSVAEKAGVLMGDEILSVNGEPYTPVASLRSSVGKEATFEVRRKAEAAPLTIAMRPVTVKPMQELLEAQRASTRVIERAGTKIGYVHLYSYAGYEYHEELLNAVTWGTLKEADALIIDLRYGLGGAAPSYLNIFNTNIPILEMYDRDGAETVFDSQWRKPAVYLVNGFSRSGKELLAFGARKYRLATVIGERTPGHVLGGRLFPLSNGDALYLAVQHCRVDGVDLEGVGVAPDIEVPFDIRYCAGHDLQLEKALEHLAGKVAG